MSKCSQCGSTENLFQNNWTHQKQYKCEDCAMKANKYRAVSELPTASEEWLQKAKEVNGRLMAKYAK